MRKWVRIEKADDGYHVLTGIDDRPGTTWFFKDLPSAVAVLGEYFGELPPIEIFVADGILMKERLS